MAMGRRKPKQQGLWLSVADIPKSASHPFYSKVNEVLAANGFDRKVEHLCRRYYYYYVKSLRATGAPNVGATIGAEPGPSEEQVLHLTTRPRQGPPRSFFWCVRFPE